MKKLALVTGGARRIGASIVRALHQQDYQIVLHYHRSHSEAEALAGSLNDLRSGSVFLYSADLASLDAIRDLAHFTETVCGPCDLLVNNASRFYPTALGSITEASWQDLFDSNVKGAFFLAQALAPGLKLRKGSIINITDIHASQPMGGYPVYSMAKAALTMMTQALAKELAPEVRVNAIAPGLTLWPEGENVLSEAEQTMLLAKTLLKRIGNAEEIAKAVVFLAEAGYITGQTLKIDGGRSL